MLTLQFVPYSEIETLNTEERIQKLLSIVKNKNIVLMQGRLKLTEETRLIQETMEQINKDFKGIEICTVYPEDKDMEALKKIKKDFFRLPASVVKEIKRDPNKIQLFTFKDNKKSKRR